MQALDFWVAVCACHNLIVETDDDDNLRYQGPSPDEARPPAIQSRADRLGIGSSAAPVPAVGLPL